MEESKSYINNRLTFCIVHLKYKFIFKYLKGFSLDDLIKPKSVPTCLIDILHVERCKLSKMLYIVILRALKLVFSNTSVSDFSFVLILHRVVLYSCDSKYLWVSSWIVFTVYERVNEVIVQWMLLIMCI